MGLLENDRHWFDTMTEACVSMSPAKLRDLFSILITNCGLSRPVDLWNDFKNFMSEDILHRMRKTNPQINFNDCIYNESLILIQNIVIYMSGKDLKHFGFPAVAVSTSNGDIIRELAYDIQVTIIYTFASS